MPTYYLRSTTAATGIHAAVKEKQIATSTAVVASDTATISGSSSDLAYCWTTVSGVPNSADWPNGTYSAELNCDTAGADITYGVRTVGSASGHFARVDSGLTADSETAQDTQAAFSGTGIKLASVSWNPSAGAASDRLEVLVAANNAGTMNQSVGFAMNTTDSEVQFPAAAATFAPPPFQRRWRYPQRRLVV